MVLKLRNTTASLVKMSCPICLNNYSDERKCFNICPQGHCVCDECYKKFSPVQQFQSRLLNRLCPICRTEMSNPIQIRLDFGQAQQPTAQSSDVFVPTVSTTETKEPQENEYFTQIEFEVDTETVNDFIDPRPVILLIDTSGSMDLPSSESNNDNVPSRIELVIHMMKILWTYCSKLKKQCQFYTFSSSLGKLNLQNAKTKENVFKTIENIRAQGCTNLGKSLQYLYKTHGDAIYFVLTDGEPTDIPQNGETLMSDMPNISMHFVAFSPATNPALLNTIRRFENCTVSYVQNIESLMGYIIPIFVYALTSKYKVTLSPEDEALRIEYIRMLSPQILGSSSEYSVAQMAQILKQRVNNKKIELENMAKKRNAGLKMAIKDRINEAPDVTNDPAIAYMTALLKDTEENAKHGRIAYSVKNSANWNVFGKFYLPCILNCHIRKIPGNAFDCSLFYYQTPQYNKLYKELLGIADNIPFVHKAPTVSQSSTNTFMGVAYNSNSTQTQNKIQNKIQHTIKAVDRYRSSYYNDDGNDGCIVKDALITMRDGSTKRMCDVKIGDKLSSGTVKWIIVIRHLYGKNSFLVYNGLTSTHPVCENGSWILAGKQSNAIVSNCYADEYVYDVVLEERDVDHMVVNGVKSAVVGYPVPGLVHPYWGSNKSIEDINSHVPNNGFVYVDGSKFKKDENGLVSSIFA